MSTPSTDYRADIDGLRAIAVGLVLLFHFDLLPLGRAGFIGVDVFYVISGFLICGIVVRDLSQQRFSLQRFYLHRIRRLAPALLCVQFAVLLVGAMVLLPGDFTELARQSIVTQLYLSNVYFWRTLGYFGLSAQHAFLLHTWSLAVEEQFYLVFPLLMLGIHRFAHQRFTMVLALGAALSFGLDVAQVHVRPEATFYLLPTRAWELLLGALAARLVVADGWHPTRWQAEGLGLLGLAVLATGVWSFTPGIAFPGYFALFPTMAAVAVLAAGARPTMTSTLLARRPLRLVGAISYPLYLVHWPIRVFAGELLGTAYTLPWRWAMLALSLLLATVIYRFVETPIRRGRWLPAWRPLGFAYLASLIAVVGICAAIVGSGGAPARFPPAVVALAALAEDREPPLHECETTPLAAAGYQPCRIGVAGDSRWLVFGDSHAWATHDAFDRWLTQRGQGGYFAFHHGCPPLRGVHLVGDEGRCHAFNEGVHAFLVAHPEVTHVALVAAWLEGAEGQLALRPDQPLSGADSAALFQQAFGATLADFAHMHRQVYLWEPVPGAKSSVPQAMALAALGGHEAGIEFTPEEYHRQFAFFFAAENASGSLISGRFSPGSALCKGARCATSIAGQPLYFDNAHPSRSSIATWLAVLQSGAGDAAGAN